MKTLFTETVGEGPNLLLLHGFGMHSGVWQCIVPQLSSNFCVTTVDLPGFGRSDMVADYSLEAICQHLLEVVPNQAIWIGWSLGGLIATKFACLYPEKVDKLICVGSSPKFTRTQDWPGVEVFALSQFSEGLKKDYAAALRRFLLLQFYGIPVDKAMMRRLSQQMLCYGIPTDAALDKGLSLLTTTDLRQELSAIRCPLLYLFGKRDTLVPSVLNEILIQYQPAMKTKIFPKASHALFLSHPVAFLNEVRCFSDG